MSCRARGRGAPPIIELSLRAPNVAADFVPLPSAEPQTWLLRVGWQRYGRISAYDESGGL
jgi:hypothetical protein